MAKSKKTRMPVESCMPARVSRDDEARERKYRAEDALRTMQRADEIKRDKGLVKDMKALAREQMAALGKVAKWIIKASL